jgi:LuxR family transcriptional regulator, quorum-sensing system regulator SolR
MDRYREELFHSFISCASEAEGFHHVLELGQTLGFDYCAYGIQAPLPITRRATALFNNYHQDWQDQYLRNNFLDCDPTVRYAHRCTLPLLWSDDFFNSTPDLWDGARAYGLCVGWAMPLRDSSGAVGLLTFARPSECISPQELQAKEASMMLAGHFVHCSTVRHWLPTVIGEAAVVLSPREREVMLWTAEGKSSSEAATILNLTERTVNFHVNNAIKKLKATNKTQAVVKAMLLGLLF